MCQAELTGPATGSHSMAKTRARARWVRKVKGLGQGKVIGRCIITSYYSNSQGPVPGREEGYVHLAAHAVRVPLG